MASTRAKGYVLAATGGLWIGVVAFVVMGNIILRETPLGVIAQALDKLPSTLRGILFLVCWGTFFLGWTVPVVFSVRLLGRQGKQENGESGSAV
jgi:hypothetical protein